MEITYMNLAERDLMLVQIENEIKRKKQFFK